MENYTVCMCECVCVCVGGVCFCVSGCMCGRNFCPIVTKFGTQVGLLKIKVEFEGGLCRSHKVP